VIFKHFKENTPCCPFEIDGPWELSFPPGLGAPEKVILPELESWTRNEDFGIRHFSGTATYSKEFYFSGSEISKGDKIYLNLGKVTIEVE